MAIHYRTCGFIIKKMDVGEADRIFTVFSRDFGKINILGRAIRKITSKLRAGIDLIFFSEIEFIQGKTYKTLTDAGIINNFKNIKNNSLKLKIAHQIAKLVDRLTPQEERDKNIFNLLSETFNKLNNLKLETENSLEARNWKLAIFYYYFLWNLFSLLGYAPELYKCVICQKKPTPVLLFFSSEEGGVVCVSCAKKIKNILKTDANTIKILRLILKRKWSLLSKLKTSSFLGKAIRNISRDYSNYLLSLCSFD